MIPERLKSNINLDASPTDPKHIVNKEYVDGNHVEISWADYKSLPDEEKNNGTIYFVPDMPVSTSGEIIGDVEYGNFFSSDIEGSSLSVGCIIEFNQKTCGNLTYDNGVKLTKGKLYLIYCNVAYIRNDDVDSHIRFDVRINGNQIWATNGISIASGSTSTCNNSALLINYNCTNDNDILTINCVSFAGVNTTIGGLSKLIITEIPNYQGLIDVSDEHIKEIAQSYLSEKDYLKLSTLSNGGYARISSWVDGNNGRTQMSFDINTSDGKTERIQFDNVDGQLSIYENDGAGNWTYKGRYIKTKVDDIPVTQISLDETKFIKLASSSGIKYCVVNGICTIQTDGVGLINTGNITVCSGLPRPLLGIARGILQVEANSDNPTKPVYIQVVGDKLSLYSTSSTGHFWGDLSYPVAES